MHAHEQDIISSERTFEIIHPKLWQRPVFGFDPFNFTAETSERARAMTKRYFLGKYLSHFPVNPAFVIPNKKGPKSAVKLSNIVGVQGLFNIEIDDRTGYFM